MECIFLRCCRIIWWFNNPLRERRYRIGTTEFFPQTNKPFLLPLLHTRTHTLTLSTYNDDNSSTQQFKCTWPGRDRWSSNVCWKSQLRVKLAAFSRLSCFLHIPVLPCVQCVHVQHNVCSVGVMWCGVWGAKCRSQNRHQPHISLLFPEGHKTETALHMSFSPGLKSH